MELRNISLANPRPRNSKEMKAYVRAASIKKSAEDLGRNLVRKNDTSVDLDPSSSGVALNDVWISAGYLGGGDVTGTASANEQGEVTHMRAEIDGGKHEGTFSYRGDSNKERFTFQSEYSQVVEHVVHDTAKDTLTYFRRDELGRFLKR